MSKIRPLADRIMVQPEEAEPKTAGGIIIPDTNKEKPMRGKVVAVGGGKYEDNGSLRPLQVKIGDKVLYGKYAGTNIELDGSEYLVMREEDVMAVIE
jgi:chaperonin GroES